MADVIVQKETPGYYAARVVWTLLGILESVLGIQFLLRLVGANPAAGFTQFMYNLASPFLAPFRGIVASTATGANAGVVVWSTLIAMIVYYAVAWAIIKLFFLTDSTDRIDYVE